MMLYQQQVPKMNNKKANKTINQGIINYQEAI